MPDVYKCITSSVKKLLFNDNRFAGSKRCDKKLILLDGHAVITAVVHLTLFQIHSYVSERFGIIISEHCIRVTVHSSQPCALEHSSQSQTHQTCRIQVCIWNA